MNETTTRRPETRSRIDRAADGRHAPAQAEQAGSVRPSPGKVWGMIGLAALTAVTSLVVATISIWLVPVYVAAMVLIFAAPRSPRPVAAPTTPEAVPEAPADDAEPPRADDVQATPGATVDAVAEPAAPAEAVDPAPAKPRKRRAKARRGKAAQATEAPASEPTWIRIGPGKFVRADDVQAAPSDVETPATPTSSPEAEPASEAVATPLGAADLLIETEATPSVDVEPDAAVEAVETLTHEDATPASPYDAEPSEVISPASFGGDEAETTESDEEYGIAPSALAGAFDEEYGIAPSALAETWTPEALPESVADDVPRPDAAPIEPEETADDPTWSEARLEVVEPAEAVDPVDEPEAEAETPTAPPTPSATAASPSPERSAPGTTATAPRGAGRTAGLGQVRRASRPRERFGRPRSPRHRGADARPTRSVQAVRIRVRGSERSRRRSTPTGRRHHPRSPPRRD